MIYVMSDLHGEYEKYRKMLEKIRFSDQDTLYVLGDVVDRGPEPVKLLKDMAGRENVFPIMGNHDAMACRLLKILLVEITEENAENHIDGGLMRELMEWMADGGDQTMKDFRRIGAEERADLLDYLGDFSLYETVDAGDRTFILVHAGLHHFAPGRRLSSYRPDELLFEKQDYGRQYFEDPSVFIVAGHTPTLSIAGKAEIYRENNNILIDCGAAFEGGRLACLCLDTMEEYYTD